MGVAEKLPPFIHRLSRSSCWIGNGQCPNTLPQWYDPLARRVTRGDPQEMGAFFTIFIYFYAFFYVCLFVCVCFLKGALIHAWKWRALYANCKLKLLILLRNHNHIISYHWFKMCSKGKHPFWALMSGDWYHCIMQFVIWSGSILSAGFGAFRRCISLRNGVLQLQLKPELSSSSVAG